MQSNRDANPCDVFCESGLTNDDQSEERPLLQSDPPSSLTPSGVEPEDTSSDLDIVTSSSFLPVASENDASVQDRELVCDDALVWLNAFPDNSLPGCVFTSLPDISEVPDVAKGRN